MMNSRSLERIVALIQPARKVPPFDVSRARPSHCWLDNITLAVGWLNNISICSLVDCINQPVR